MFYAKVPVTLVAILGKEKNSLKHGTGEHEHALEFFLAQLEARSQFY